VELPRVAADAAAVLGSALLAPLAREDLEAPRDAAGFESILGARHAWSAPKALRAKGVRVAPYVLRW
jgi:hypothetical protein